MQLAVETLGSSPQGLELQVSHHACLAFVSSDCPNFDSHICKASTFTIAISAALFFLLLKVRQFTSIFQIYMKMPKYNIHTHICTPINLHTICNVQPICNMGCTLREVGL